MESDATTGNFEHDVAAHQRSIGEKIDHEILSWSILYLSSTPAVLFFGYEGIVNMLRWLINEYFVTVHRHPIFVRSGRLTLEYVMVEILPQRPGCRVFTTPSLLTNRLFIASVLYTHR